MKKARNIIAVLLAFAMSLSLLAGCGSKSEESNPSSSGSSPGQTTGNGAPATDLVDRDLVTPDPSRKSTANSDELLPYMQIAISSSYAPSELGPEKYNDSSKHQILSGIYEQLIEKIDVDQYEMLLAKNYYWEDDLNLIVELYDYIYDSDGNHLTASDVVFSYDTVIAASQLSSASFLDSYSAVDEFTVRFTFTKELDLNAFDDILVKTWIFTEKAYQEHDMSTDPVGTGPYKLKYYTVGSAAEIEARGEYWQKDELVDGLSRATVQVLHLDFLSDNAMILIALEQGNSAYAQLDRDSLPAFVNGGEYDGKFNVYNFAREKQGWSLTPNLSEASLCSDINLRLAIFYAVNTEGFCQALGANTFGGCTVNAPRTCSDYQESWDSWENYMTTYDPDKAKEYLEKSDYNGETLMIACEDNTNKKTIALALQGMLEAIGIKVEMNIVARALLSSTLADENAWDIMIASDKNDYAVSRLYQIYSEEYGYVDGYPVNFCTDETLQTMLQECNTQKGYSIEKTEEIMQYMIDNAYDYTIAYEAVKPSAYDLRMAQIASKWGMGSVDIILTACDYYLDME